MWFRVDDSFFDHPKAMGLPDSAIVLWLKAGCWAARRETDGYVPNQVWRELGGPHWRSTVNHLADSLLIEPSDDPAGYTFHDWKEYQLTRNQITARREASAARSKSYRATHSESASRRDATPRHAVTQAESNGVTGGVRHGVSHGVTEAERHAVTPRAAQVPNGGTSHHQLEVVDGRASHAPEPEHAPPRVGEHARDADAALPDDDDLDSSLIKTDYRAIDAAIASEIRRLTGQSAGAETTADIRAELLTGRQVANPGAYVTRAVRDQHAADPALSRWLGPGDAPEPAGARSGPPSAKPAWCGECDERTRMRGYDGDHPSRCIRCHPLARTRPHRPGRRAHPSATPAADALDRARNADDYDPGRGPDPTGATAHRGADEARRLLAERAAEQAAAKAAAAAEHAERRPGPPRPIADVDLPEPEPGALRRDALGPLPPGDDDPAEQFATQYAEPDHDPDDDQTDDDDDQIEIIDPDEYLDPNPNQEPDDYGDPPEYDDECPF